MTASCHTARSKLAAAILLAMPLPAAAESEAFPALCAERDLRLVTAIEEHGQSQDVATKYLVEAGFGLMHARKACREGREAEAFALYDRLTLTLIAGPLSIDADRRADQLSSR